METTIKKGIIFNVKKYAIDDGPGIRTTIFLKGCPLRCWWCHNPEGQVSEPELMYKKNRCNGCGNCISNCPRKAISPLSHHVSIDRKQCDLCGNCSQKCPTDALAIIGKKITVGEIMEEIEKDLIFYDESEGGVTFSGGEPLLQPTFLTSLLEKCQKKTIHTTVDTCGYVPYEIIDKIRDKTDLFLYDIKALDDKKHRKYTGVSNKPILENFKKLAENGSNLLVRFPIIPGVNDDEDNIVQTAEFMLSCGVNQIALLPYHRAGIEKYKSLGRVYRLEKTQSPSDRELNAIKKKLETLGLTVKIGG